MTTTLKDRFIDGMHSAGHTKKRAGEIFTELMNDIAYSLLHEGQAKLPGVGVLKVAQRAARTGRNPANGETMEIPAKSVIKFTSTKDLSEALN